jgi:hypothetical protein
MISTITKSNIRMHAYNQGADIMIIILGAKTTNPERWISKHTHLKESFADAAFRAFTKLAGELNTKIVSMQGSK